MKNLIFLLCAVMFIQSLSAMENWQSHWTSAIQHCEKDEFSDAENYFDKAIEELEKSENKDHPHIYVDRARLLHLLDRPQEALLDVNKVMDSDKLTEYDRMRALATRMSIYNHLDMNELAKKDYNEFVAMHPNMPKTEIYDDHMIIRNVPDSELFDKITTRYFLETELCEKESDIQKFRSGIWIIKKNQKKPCNCDKKDDVKNAHSKKSVDHCNGWCDTVAAAAEAWCGRRFKNYGCILGCVLVVEAIKKGCYWCCSEGNFHDKCIRPFETINEYNDVACDLYWN